MWKDIYSGLIKFNINVLELYLEEYLTIPLVQRTIKMEHDAFVRTTKYRFTLLKNLYGNNFSAFLHELDLRATSRLSSLLREV